MQQARKMKVEEEVKKVILSVTSITVKTGAPARRNSTEKANTKTLSSDPHYLRASTSSCHDFCKYGRKHDFEPKKRNPNLHRFSDSSKIQNKEEKQEVPTLQRRMKRPEMKVNAAKPDGVKLLDKHEVVELEPFESFDHSPSIEGEVSSETMRIESSSPVDKRVISHEPITPFFLLEKSLDRSEIIELESSSPINSPKDRVIESSEEPLGVEIRSKPTAPSPTQKNLKAHSLLSSKRNTASAKVQASERALSMKLKSPTPIHKNVASKEEENLMNSLKMEGKEREMKTSPPLVTEISVKTKAIKEKKTESTKQKSVDQNSLPSVKKVVKPVLPKVTKQKISSTTKRINTPVMKSTPSLISSKRVSALRNIGNKLTRSINLPKPRENPAMMKSRAPVAKKEYVIEPKKKELMKVRAQPSSSSPKCKEKRILSKTISSEVNSPSPHKLMFQRGKIISPMSENNSPHKLKFRQAKGIILKSEAGRKSFRRRRGSFGSSSELGTPRLKAPSVILRHQDVKEKKEAQGLFNHVIEETANKLVEIKKSKVMALVSAFETVISLQESRVK